MIQDEGCKLQIQLQLDSYGNGKKSDSDISAYQQIRNDIRRGDIVGARGYAGASRKGSFFFFW